MNPNTMTVAFIGASTGVGLATLKRTLAAGHQCIALCRTPSKLTDILPPKTTPNLRVVAGNAHDVEAVSQCLRAGNGKIVDKIVTTIGAAPVVKGLSVTMDDPHVCEKGMSTLLEAIAGLRKQGLSGNLHIVACSTTSVSRFGRDIPVPMIPVYWAFVRVPGRDKLAMEDLLTASGEQYTILHPSHLSNGESTKRIRVGIEDPRTGREVEVIGYSISREDAGKWTAENVVLKLDQRYQKKIVVITY